MKKILLTTICLLFVFTSFVSADSNQNNKQVKKPINNAIVAYNNLSLAIDFWHDATLKGDLKAIGEHKQMMFEIISENIQDSRKSVSFAKLEASYAKEEVKKSGNISDNMNDKSDLKNEESRFNAKKLLFSSLEKSKSFSYSYRLLADYLEILRNEIDFDKIELAGDDSDIQDDAGQIRFIK